MSKYQYQYGDKPLAGYTIQRAVGRGGFGEVYYAISDTGRQVALKAVQTYEQIELRGIQQCMNLKNPHLVSVFDARYNDEGKLFVIMEYVSGPSLADMIQSSSGGLGVQKTAFFLREIAKGLNYLHDSGIVHRDLKPGNIFYEDGQVKIGDYGLSKVINTSRYSNQTITVGTVHYMAPEIGVGKYDRSIDIYALGVIIYEMLTGQLPYVGASPAEVLMKHMNADPDVSRLDQTFARVIKKAMARDPQQRYSTVQELVEDVFGAEQIQQSMSQFSPMELSMAARQVAEKIQKQPAPTSPTGQPAPEKPGKGERLYRKIDKVHSLVYKEDTEELKAASARDPMKKKQRLLLALFTSAILAGGTGLCMGFAGDDILDAGLPTFLMIIGGAAGILLSRHKWLTEMEANPFRNWAAAAVAILFAGLVSFSLWNQNHVMNDHQLKGTYIALVVLVFLNWWKLTDVRRKNRVSVWPAVIAGTLAFVIALIFHGQPIISIAVVAGVCLYVQILSPFIGAQEQAPVHKPIPPKQPRPPQRPPVPALQVSPLKRIWALILCAGIFLGFGGLHRFYAGKIGTGLLWFFTGGLFGIGQLIDFIMIMTGEFRDSKGRKIIVWEDKQQMKTPAYAPAPAVQTAQPNNMQSPQAAAGPVPHQQTPPAAQAQIPSSPTTVVIQDPNAKISVFSSFLSFVGYVLMTLSLLFLIGCALNLIAIAVACLPDDVANEVEQFWGSPNWVSALRGLVMFISLIVLTGAATVLLILRRRFGGAHIVRFIIAMGMLALALVIVFDCSGSAPVVNESFIGQPAGVFFDKCVASINGDVFASLFFFIPAVVLLAWPPKKLAPQIVTLNPDYQVNQQ